MRSLPKSFSIALIVMASIPPAWAQSNLKDRLSAATEAIENSCGNDVQKFCGNVTRGEGRLLLCMQAHEDQLSRRCQFSLYRASRGLSTALHRVERIADACWSDIQAKCQDADGIGRCIVEKRDSLSKACQRVAGALQKAAQGLASLRGMPVYSSDSKDIGRVVNVKRGPDGKVQSIQVEVGRFLGLGSKVVEIDGAALEQLADRIRLRVGGEQIQSLPEVPKQ